MKTTRRGFFAALGAALAIAPAAALTMERTQACGRCDLDLLYGISPMRPAYAMKFHADAYVMNYPAIPKADITAWIES